MKNFVSYFYNIKDKSTGDVHNSIGDFVIDYPIESEADIESIKATIDNAVRAACVAHGSDFELVSVSIITWKTLHGEA
jgi:hypothetical protein